MVVGSIQGPRLKGLMKAQRSLAESAPLFIIKTHGCSPGFFSFWERWGDTVTNWGSVNGSRGRLLRNLLLRETQIKPVRC